MKKLITCIIAIVAATSIATAAGPRKAKSLEKLGNQLERITNFLDEKGDEIAEGKKSALEHRASILELQIEVRAAVRAALAELDEDATKEEVREAVHAARVQFKDQFQALKEERRALRAERRANREDAEEEVEDSTPEG